MYEKKTEIGREEEEKEKKMWNNEHHNLLNYLFNIFLINNSHHVRQVELKDNIALLHKIHILL